MPYSDEYKAFHFLSGVAIIIFGIYIFGGYGIIPGKNYNSSLGIFSSALTLYSLVIAWIILFFFGIIWERLDKDKKIFLLKKGLEYGLVIIATTLIARIIISIIIMIFSSIYDEIIIIIDVWHMSKFYFTGIPILIKVIIYIMAIGCYSTIKKNLGYK